MYGYYCVIFKKKKKTFLGRQHTLLLIPDREPMTDHNTDTVKVQWVLFKLPVGVWVQCYLQEQKWLKDIFITKALKSWAPRAHYIACIGSSTGWRVSFLGGLVWASSRLLGWPLLLFRLPDCPFLLSSYLYLGERGLVNLFSLRNLLGLFRVVCFLS